MSYRTYVNGVQVFGNNEYYDEWIDFIKSCGIQVDEDGAYEGDITDFMGALVVVEKITLQLNQKRDEFEKRICWKVWYKENSKIF